MIYFFVFALRILDRRSPELLSCKRMAERLNISETLADLINGGLASACQ